MVHKHAQVQINAVINMWRGKHALEKLIAEYGGNKWKKMVGPWGLEPQTSTVVSATRRKSL